METFRSVCRYEGMLLDIELAPLSVLVLQHRHPALEDVYTLDPALYQSLMQVLTVLATFLMC